MSYLHAGIGKLKSLTYLFVEDNDDGRGMIKQEGGRRGFEIPEELGCKSLVAQQRVFFYVEFSHRALSLPPTHPSVVLVAIANGLPQMRCPASSHSVD